MIVTIWFWLPAVLTRLPQLRTGCGWLATQKQNQLYQTHTVARVWTFWIVCVCFWVFQICRAFGQSAHMKVFVSIWLLIYIYFTRAFDLKINAQTKIFSLIFTGFHCKILWMANSIYTVGWVFHYLKHMNNIYNLLQFHKWHQHQGLHLSFLGILRS